METYRLSSKLREKDREYLIQTSNDVTLGSVSTTVYVDGLRTDTQICPHPEEMPQEQLLALVKEAHGNKKKEVEGLLRAYRHAGAENDSELMYRLATALYYKKLYHEAADLLNGAIHLRPEYHQAYDRLGQACLAAGRADAALEAATRAVSFKPGYPDYRNHLGEAYLAVGSAAEAVSEFEVAINTNMYYSEAYFNLALAYTLEASSLHDRQQILQNVAKVQENVQKASLVYPEYKSHCHYQEGLQALERHDFGRALSLLKSVSEARKEARRQGFIAVNRRLLAHPETWTVESVGEQIESLRAELDKHPTYLDLQSELVRCYFEQAGMVWDRGLEECQSILEGHPGNEPVSGILESALEIRALMLETVEAVGKKG